MGKALKGITVEINGSTENLVKALEKPNAEAASLQKELKGVNSLLKLDPKNTELLEQKQVLLKQAVQQTEEKMKLLTEAEKQMAAAGKDVNDDAYRDLQREIAATAQKLDSLKSQISTFDKMKTGAQNFGKSLANIAQKIPGVNKLTTAFGNAKQKITETVKESKTVKTIGTAVDGARQKVEAFKNAHPAVQKVADAFGKAKAAAGDLAGKMPSVTQVVQAAGSAATTAAKGGWSVLTTTVGGTIKAFTAFSAAATTAMVAITKGAVENYGDYEQLVGGVETLFGAGGQSLSEYAKSAGKTTTEAKDEYNNLIKAQEAVIEKANGAYKTAGMSANDYMETVTSMSAALIQSLDGDTVAAAEKADMAITDMSDNANKMGSDIESIKNAYSGFAKANYTMLDNLKLGYGGTKEEMQRLLDDATKISGVKYDISQYGDIVDAIHVVQTEMGITGTTAKEAATTIQGSIASAKAAWTNLQTGLADENADLDALVGELVDSVVTVIDNIAPRVMAAVPRILKAVPQLITGLSGAAKELAGEAKGLGQSLIEPLTNSFFTLIQTAIAMLPQLLPEVLNAAVMLFTGILQGLNQTIPQLAAILPQLITTITSTITQNLPSIISEGAMILVNLINGITQAIPTLIQSIVDLIPVIVQAIAENLPQIVEAGLNLLVSLITGIVQAIPQLVDMLPTIITTIITVIIQSLPQILDAGVQILTALINGLIQAIPQLIAMLPTIITTITNVLIQNLPQIISAGIQLIGALISGLIQAIPVLVAAIPQIVTAIFTTFKNVNWGELGSNIISGIKDGVVNAAKNLASAVADAAKSALDAAKEALGIHSPSRVFRDQVGKQMAAGQLIGYEEGMEDNADAFAKASRKSVPTTIDGYIAAGSGSNRQTAQQGQQGGFTQNVNIYSPRELSPSETARQTRNATRQMVLKLKPT